MTAEMRYSLRAACWGLMAGGVLTETIGWFTKTPAYFVVAAAVILLAVGWVWDSATRAEAPAPVTDPVQQAVLRHVSGKEVVIDKAETGRVKNWNE